MTLFEPDSTGARWRLSPSALRPIECSVEGILSDGGCGGACCKGTTFWPAKAGEVEGQCDHLGPNGCTLGDERPASCHLYPLRLRRDLLVLHYAGAILGTYCKGCRGHGPPVIEALAPSLRLLFGEQADEAIAALYDGRPATLNLSPSLLEALQEEAEWEANNEVPKPRDWSRVR